MAYLCISVRFLQPYAHGRDNAGDPEWPPSPLRLFQAFVAASARRWNERTILNHAVPALRWLEGLTPPRIIAAQIIAQDKSLCVPYRIYLPDNIGDQIGIGWSRGQDVNVAEYRSEHKDVRPTYLEGEAVHYLYSLPDGENGREHVETIAMAARAMTHLGWGIDMVVADAVVMEGGAAAELPGQHWVPGAIGGTVLRTPKAGTMDDLARKHADFLSRLGRDGFRPVPPLREFDVVRYRRKDEPLRRPYRVFELRDSDGSRYRYPPRRLIHLAGMLRHLAIEAMKRSAPADVDEDWVETYIAGHARPDAKAHRQLSYLPLPSLGHVHTDPGVRRVMIAAPAGDDPRLDYVARRLAGQILRPKRGDEFRDREPPLLVPVRNDNIARFYTEPAGTWHSVTPVILPGHDDHKPAKTRALIERALRQSGIDQPCAFEWSAFSRFPKCYSAHKYDREKRLQGYIRPDHLPSQTAVHLTLRFHDGSESMNPVDIPGPLVIGAGRHCGFGLMARAFNKGG